MTEAVRGGSWLPALAALGVVAVLSLGSSSCAEPPPPIDGANMPAEGLLTSGQPTPDELEAAVRAGYRTVINLRTESETGFEWEREAVERLGARYVWIPVAGEEGLTRDAVRHLDADLRDGAEQGGVLVHCASGNRVGAMLALREAWFRDAGAEDALRFGVSAGLTKLEPATRRILEFGAEPAP